MKYTSLTTHHSQLTTHHLQLIPMILSKHNIFSRIHGTNEYFIVNLLSGNADILDEATAKAMQANDFFNSDFVEKGYVVDEEDEKKRYSQAYNRFIQERDQDEVQLFFVPGYECNFSCSYCYQDQYAPLSHDLKPELLDAFFNYVKSNFGDRKKYITVFGGEPLLGSEKNKEFIRNFLQRSKTENLDVAFVTNGYTLAEYVDVLKNAKIREIQVTLDGMGEVHNQRRSLKGGQGTFDHIVSGIDAVLDQGLMVNLRMVVDKENIDQLPLLANFAKQKGWIYRPNFKTQLGRNYELHHCQEKSQRLYSRIELYQEIFSLIKQYPEIIEFHKPAFSIAKFLSENGELPEPLFDSCPGCKTEWAFDYTGNIYSCTATVGKAGEELGTFYPQVSLNKSVVADWQKRDVTTIDKCENCAVQLACGGGCASVAKNNNNESICSADCRPVKELLELGMAAYFV